MKKALKENTPKIMESKNRLLLAAKQTAAEVFAYYNNSLQGYTQEQVQTMLEQYGRNTIAPKNKDSIFKRLFDAFVNPFSIVLFLLACVSFTTDYLLVPAGEGELSTVLIVAIILTLSGLMRFIQESRSEKAAEKLSEMVETTIAVQRDNTNPQTGLAISEKREIPLDELVVGDLLHLAAGDMIPADVRIVRAKDLFISQSSLTGESEPVEKFATTVVGEQNNPLELNNLAFMGSNVISGAALALVVAVGSDTLFGTIAKDLTAKKPPTSFEKGVNSVSWVLIRFMLVMVPCVFFINGFTKGEWLQSFAFALSVAIGLTPELLPMIVSANLAKGAVAMSKKNVIVKDLNSIQNFGAMDVLCTDKTGTITQDKIILEYYLDIHGNDDMRILRHAFLNSYHQTGLKNLMDLAVIERAQQNLPQAILDGYTKIDEIPFDFNRRRMSVLVANTQGKTQMITKGAIEEMLAVCDRVEYRDKIEPLTPELHEEIISVCRKYNNNGMRVLGIAQKNNHAPEASLSVADECNMVLIGYLAFLDPPKESATAAIQILHEYGVQVKVLTGDNDAVTKCVCKQVGIATGKILLGADIENMSDEHLKLAVEHTHIFAKLSPKQKARIVTTLRDNGHTVGFMGDGINDATAMKAADVGISVDTAVDIAKESANIILLEKDLMVLEEGVIEGRKIYANIMKYIKMTASSNFGNMFSVLAASAFLPFLPMLPIQILTLNLIYDISCTSIPWDNVDPEYLKKPRKWDASSISNFMIWIGPTSSVFDITTYLLLFFYICPMIFGGSYSSLSPDMQEKFIMLFHAGWFVESLWTQTMVIHSLRTPKIPFIQSMASWQLTLITSLAIMLGTLLPYTAFGEILDMYPLPWQYFPILLLTLVGYLMLVNMLKKKFIARYGELL